jgi:NAD(P)-dependent dehydrogenase (short-subunit alcohol dehydrogenase family)|tara:strand:+ start:1049 stop:1753 length:705 start_codon:yes stop_codon:yes gene_type:complete
MSKQKVALFIAAGSGMGADAAKNLATKGFKIGILSSSGKGEKLANDLGGIGFTGSNQSNADIKKLVNKILKKWGRIDVLVNSAGHGPRGPILKLSDEDWHNGLETYFLNVVRSTRIVAPIMEKQKSGVIINISTFAVFEPDAIFPTSGVFRAGLASFTKLFVDQYSHHNIRMNNILPGFIDSLPEKKEFKKRIPLKRYGKVNEISEFVSFLASEGGAYITGQNIRVDGGITKSI